MKLYHALFAGLAACSFVMAQDAATTAPAATEKAAPVAKAKMMSVHGKVIAVDAMTNTIIVKTKKGEDTLSTTDKTSVMPKGKTLGDIKADDHVAISYKVEDGKWVATMITLHASKKMAPAAAPMTPAAPAAPMPPAGQ
jgi:hypothetical protein